MMHLLFLFLDGVGLGAADPARNPLAAADMPNLASLLGGRRLLAESAPFEGTHATLVALDATLGITGLPQSATGQAALLTGLNIPAKIGEHYGPKPSPEVARILEHHNLFFQLRDGGLPSAVLNAYPPRYFHAVSSGRRLYSAIPLAATSAGIRLPDKDDLYNGRALSADFTGEGWIHLLGFADAPLIEAENAGARLARLSTQSAFSLFEYWATDYAGHKQDMPWALRQLHTFDQVIGGLIAARTADLLILITSDHGNFEDLSTRRHTLAPVPALIIGGRAERRALASSLHDLTDVAPAITRLLLAV